MTREFLFSLFDFCFIEALLYNENAILREVQVLRLRLNWIVHSIFGSFNMCQFLFVTQVKCALLRIHSSVAAILFSVRAKHNFKKLKNDTDNFKVGPLLNFRPASINKLSSLLPVTSALVRLQGRLKNIQNAMLCSVLLFTEF